MVKSKLQIDNHLKASILKSFTMEVSHHKALDRGAIKLSLSLLK